MSHQNSESFNPNMLDTNLPEGGKNKRNPALIVGGSVILLIALVLLLFGGSLFGNDATSLDTVAVDQTQPNTIQLPESGLPLQVGDRPYEFNLKDLRGNNVALSQFIGQPILINFWATWCGPCRIEMPELQAVFNEYGANGTREDGLVILALDQDESAGEVEAFFDELGLTFTPLLDDGSETAANFGLRGTLPTSVFIKPDGEISVIHRGIMTKGQLESFLAETIPGKMVDDEIPQF